MGGGKSHACIGAWHLATNPQVLAAEDIGRKVFEQAEMAPWLCQPDLAPSTALFWPHLSGRAGRGGVTVLL